MGEDVMKKTVGYICEMDVLRIGLYTFCVFFLNR